MFDSSLASRVRAALSGTKGVEERQMFGGVGFLVRGNFCVGVSDADLVLRLTPDAAAEALDNKHVHQFDMSGRPMPGWIRVEAAGVRTKPMLVSWVAQARELAKTLQPK